MMYAMNICMRIPLIDCRCCKGNNKGKINKIIQYTINELLKKIERMHMYVRTNLIKNEELKLIITLQDDIDIFLKELIILITQKLIKNLCETVKVVTLRDKCSNCDE